MAMTQHTEIPGAPVASDDQKPIHTLVLDTAPILLNTPSISTLLANCHNLVTTESVLSEVRGEEARARLDTLYKPFLTIRTPKPESVDLIRDFARKTGDSGVLSGTDLEMLALAYDLECERNGGDWRLRKTPGQKRLNGSPPSKATADGQHDSVSEQQAQQDEQDSVESELDSFMIEDAPEPASTLDSDFDSETRQPVEQIEADGSEIERDEVSTEAMNNNTYTGLDDAEVSTDSDGEWITPSNIKRHQTKEDSKSNSTKMEVKTMQVATMTGDFAMQNVLLQMNLNLLSTKTCKRVAHIKQMILRCHGCFNTTRDMSKQFCPRCGKPTMTRVTCTTNDKGEVKLHLKANHQWNNRGNVFSIPKPTAGSANQKWKGPRQGGGQGGWGSNLILSEDQKEYTRAVSGQRRSKNKDLMDEDTLPSLLTGDRGHRNGGRIQIGGGRNINSRKR